MKVKLISALAVGLISVAPAVSSAVILDFEGATSFESLNNFYNGGTDSAGAAGTNYGISFGGDALALANDVVSTYFTNAPSPVTAMTPVSNPDPLLTNASLNVASGFAGTASFYYSSTAETTVEIFSGLNGTGSSLGTFNLANNATSGCSDSPYCHWDLLSVTFAGVAQSIKFGTAGDVAAFDNVTVAPVPLPAAGWLMLSALGGIGSFVRRKRAAALSA